MPNPPTDPHADVDYRAVRAQLTEDEAEEIAGRLPLDLLPLWRRPC